LMLSDQFVRRLYRKRQRTFRTAAGRIGLRHDSRRIWLQSVLELQFSAPCCRSSRKRWELSSHPQTRILRRPCLSGRGL